MMIKGLEKLQEQLEKDNERQIREDVEKLKKFEKKDGNAILRIYGFEDATIFTREETEFNPEGKLLQEDIENLRDNEIITDYETARALASRIYARNHRGQLIHWVVEEDGYVPPEYPELLTQIPEGWDKAPSNFFCFDLGDLSVSNSLGYPSYSELEKYCELYKKEFDEIEKYYEFYENCKEREYILKIKNQDVILDDDNLLLGD